LPQGKDVFIERDRATRAEVRSACRPPKRESAKRALAKRERPKWECNVTAQRMPPARPRVVAWHVASVWRMPAVLGREPPLHRAFCCMLMVLRRACCMLIILRCDCCMLITMLHCAFCCMLITMLHRAFCCMLITMLHRAFCCTRITLARIVRYHPRRTAAAAVVRRDGAVRDDRHARVLARAHQAAQRGNPQTQKAADDNNPTRGSMGPGVEQWVADAVLTRCSRRAHAVATRWPRGGHAVVTRWSSCSDACVMAVGSAARLCCSARTMRGTHGVLTGDSSRGTPSMW
jgi:hypothetical protein